MGGVLLVKKFFMLIGISFLLSSCSSATIEPKEKQVNEEKVTSKNKEINETKDEELREPVNALDKIAVACEEDSYYDCNAAFNENKGELTESEIKLLEAYLKMSGDLNSGEMDFEVMSFLKDNVNKDTFIRYRKVSYRFSKFLEDKVYPIVSLYNSRTVRIGMSQKELLFSMGRPNKVNRTVSSGSTSEQWVYDNIYVYLEDEEVTSFQD
jgi:hypothetical protein